MTGHLWIDPIAPALRGQAIEAFKAGDVEMFLSKTSNEHGLVLVELNMLALKKAGMYERAHHSTRFGSWRKNPPTAV